MATIPRSFERIAEAVARRTADLLAVPASVVDDRGVVVASCGSDLARPPDADRDGHAELLRVPIRLEGQSGAVLVAPSSNGEVVPPRLVHALVDLVIDQTAVVARLPNQYELKNKLIHDLLHGAAGDEADVVREGQILGMDFTRPRAVILIDAADHLLAEGPFGTFEANAILTRRRAEQVVDSVVRFFNLPSATICAHIGGGEVAVLKASSTQDLAPWSDRGDATDGLSPSWANLAALKRAGSALLARLQRDTNAAVSLGIGRYHPGIRNLARSYQDARVALMLGRRFHGRNRVHCLDDLGVAAFVGISDERTKVELARHLLGPLDQEPELLETLAAFFDTDCAPSATAARLAIHRNTLGYRLDKIASLTGLDPRRFDDAVQIRLALVLRSLQGDALQGDALQGEPA